MLICRFMILFCVANRIGSSRDQGPILLLPALSAALSRASKAPDHPSF